MYQPVLVHTCDGVTYLGEEDPLLKLAWLITLTLTPRLDQPTQIACHNKG